MKAHTQETQSTMTPQKALQFLKEGNVRFVNNLRLNRNLLQQVNETRDGQWPFATILSCIDSRISAELVFDQGLGDIFSIRIAGNVINDDILGSLEFACQIANSKLIAVVGHTKCGAITGACKGVELDHLTSLLGKVDPAIKEVKEQMPDLDQTGTDFIEAVAQANIHNSIREIREKSSVLNTLLEQGKIGIAGGVYSVDSGVVDFFEEIFNS